MRINSISVFCDAYICANWLCSSLDGLVFVTNAGGKFCVDGEDEMKAEDTLCVTLWRADKSRIVSAVMEELVFARTQSINHSLISLFCSSVLPRFLY